MLPFINFYIILAIAAVVVLILSTYDFSLFQKIVFLALVVAALVWVDKPEWFESLLSQWDIFKYKTKEFWRQLIESS